LRHPHAYPADSHQRASSRVPPAVNDEPGSDRVRVPSHVARALLAAHDQTHSPSPSTWAAATRTRAACRLVRCRAPLRGTHARVPHRRTAVVVGALFVFQLLTFAVGSNLVEEYLRGEASRQTLTIGVMLEMCSGIAVVGIGLLMYRVLKEVDRKWAIGYPIARLVEFGVSAVLATYLVDPARRVPEPLAVGLPAHSARRPNPKLSFLRLRIGTAGNRDTRAPGLRHALAHCSARLAQCDRRRKGSWTSIARSWRPLRVSRPASVAHREGFRSAVTA
jgi:hypothetical protein